MRNLQTTLAASGVALALAIAPAAAAQQSSTPQRDQTTQGGTSGSVDGRNVSVGTYGYGTATPTGTQIEGGGDATAVDGTATTRTDARANEQRAMQRSVATARTDDERARSRTMTRVQPDGTIRSTTKSRYKARGEKPVKESERVVVNPDGTTSTRSK